MANTYTQINIHAVFAVKGSQNQLSDKLRSELFQYIYGILKNKEQFPLAVNVFHNIAPLVQCSSKKPLAM